jgi:hypothetical protein
MAGGGRPLDERSIIRHFLASRHILKILIRRNRWNWLSQSRFGPT